MDEVKILENKPFAQIRDFRRFGGNFDFRGMGPILGGLAPIFFCSPIIDYILGWYTALPLNPDFLVRKSKIPRGVNIPPPPS